MPVDRLLPSQEARDLIELTRDIADKVLAPMVDEHEKAETYPEGVFPTLGEAGLLSLPYPEEFGGGGQPYEVYLQVLEELAARWAAVAVATSVHSLSCSAARLRHRRTEARWLPDMLGGNTIGAYSLSEPQAGSDAAALSCKATRRRRRVPHQRLQGVDHQRRHRRLLHPVRPHRREARAASPASWSPGDRGPELRQARGEDGPARGPHHLRPLRRRLRRPPNDASERRDRACQIAFSALDSGRLGIAAVAVGLAQAALDDAVAYAKERTAFGKQDHRPPGPRLPARRHGRRRRLRPRHLPRRRPPPRRRAAVLPPGQGRQAGRHRRRDEGHHRRRPGVRRLRLHPRLPGRAVHARGQDHPDLRGHQPDSAPGDQPRSLAN